MAQPAGKRRRLDVPGHDLMHEASTYTLIRRRYDDMRLSLQDVHSSLNQYGDVIVRVHGEHATEDFPCVSALLASSSRPLGVMLFGPLSSTEPATDDDSDKRRRLHLRMTEPDHFKHLLMYIHGEDLPLKVDEAFQMHHVADFYEVLGLRDACCRFLLDRLTRYPHNCCHLLARASEHHCEPFLQRCLDLLALDLINVVENDAKFPALSAECLKALLSRDELVCMDEFDVFDAIATWYEHSPSHEKHAALLQLLRLVRWPLVEAAARAYEEQSIAAGAKRPLRVVWEKHGAERVRVEMFRRVSSRNDVLKVAARLRPPRSSMGGEPEPSSYEAARSKDDGGASSSRPSSSVDRAVADRLEKTWRLDGTGGEAAEDDEDEQLDSVDGDHDFPASRPRASGGGKERTPILETPSLWEEGETEAARLVRALWPESEASSAAAASASSAEPAAAASITIPRRFFWGQLVSRTPPKQGLPAGAPVGGEGEVVYDLRSTKEYMVGRSRKSDIRVGHLAQMPYISSQHFRLFHSIRWPEVVSGNQQLYEDQRAPVLEAWIEDLSQNGTFVNGVQLGKNKSQVLHPGDRIEMVFPESTSRAQPQQVDRFPIFTYQPYRQATASSASEPLPVSSTNAVGGCPDPIMVD